MIELFKEDGTLKHRVKLLYDFTEMKVAEAKEAWLEEQRVAYALAYPSFEMVIDEDGVDTIVDLVQVVSFDEYLAETVVVQVAAEATDTTEAVAEIVALAREFVAPEVTETMLDAYLNTNDDYVKYVRAEAMITGKDYNGYQISLTAEDGNGLLQAKAAFELGVASTNFKCANGTIMPILAKDFLAFGMWFVTERNIFFEGL